MVASLAVLSAARVPMVASLAVLSAARFRWSHWLYYLQLDSHQQLLSSFLEGIVTTVRVRKVFSLCRQILKDIIMANQEVDAIKRTDIMKRFKPIYDTIDTIIDLL
jgi:hypothetical protein